MEVVKYVVMERVEFESRAMSVLQVFSGDLCLSRLDRTKQNGVFIQMFFYNKTASNCQLGWRNRRYSYGDFLVRKSQYVFVSSVLLRFWKPQYQTLDKKSLIFLRYLTWHFNLSAEILTERFRALALEKREFEFQELWKMWKLSWHFRLVRIQTQGTISTILTWIAPVNYQNFD